MSNHETRSFASELEIRSNGDGRTVSGIVVPYGEHFQLGNLRETFVPGAFEKSIRQRGDRIALYALHDDMARQYPIGKASMLREDKTGLYGEFKVSPTPKGEEALQLVRDGVLSGFSLNFSPLDGGTKTIGDVIERRHARLNNVSLVDDPAYVGAKVLALRTSLQDDIADDMEEVDSAALLKLRTYIASL